MQDELLARWMQEYGDSILRMCFLYLKDYHLAEDAAQETFLKAARSYGTFEHASSEKTWLIRIAINCCKNIMRTRWFRTPPVSLAEAASESVNPFDTLLQQNSLASAIASLPRADRELILMYYYQDLSTKEIAEIIHKTVNTTAQRIHRAKVKLKKILQEVDYEEA